MSNHLNKNLSNIPLLYKRLEFYKNDKNKKDVHDLYKLYESNILLKETIIKEKKKIKLFIVDDDKKFSKAFHLLFHNILKKDDKFLLYDDLGDIETWYFDKKCILDYDINKHIPIIFIDINLGEYYDGFNVARILREKYKNIITIAITVNLEVSKSYELFKNFDSFIFKPINKEKLEILLKTISGDDIIFGKI